MKMGNDMTKPKIFDNENDYTLQDLLLYQVKYEIKELYNEVKRLEDHLKNNKVATVINHSSKH